MNGHEAAGRRVVAERTRLERFADVGEEWHMDVLMLRRFHRFPLDREGAHVFTRFYLPIMINEENSFRHRRQKKVMRKMLEKYIIPFIYKNRVWCLDKSLWPVSIRDALKHLTTSCQPSSLRIAPAANGRR